MYSIIVLAAWIRYLIILAYFSQKSNIFNLKIFIQNTELNEEHHSNETIIYFLSDLCCWPSRKCEKKVLGLENDKPISLNNVNQPDADFSYQTFPLVSPQAA